MFIVGGLNQYYMKRQILFLIVILFHICLFGQKWENIYGNPGSDEAFSDMIELYDYGYLIASFYESNDGCWLIKTDLNGNMIWEKFITWPDVNIFGGFLDQDDNGNIYIATVVAGGPSGYWPMITKLDSCGEKAWCRVFQDYNYNYGWFNDVLVLDNGDILALGELDSEEEIEKIFLFYIESDGNLLWRQGYASQDNYPHIRETNCDGIRKYGNNYIIHGHCYYPYPSDTTHFFQRPLFIMLDSLFNEQWIIPFGVGDSIIGKAYHSILLNDSTYMGVGVRRLPGDIRNSLMMFFNTDGEELGFAQIDNNDITQGLSTNLIHDIARITDTLFLASSYFRYGSEPGQWGEIIIDTSGNIYQYEMRNQSTSDWTKMVKTFDNKYTIGCGWDEGDGKTDIYLYKINKNLEQDTIYPGNYTYDSLCPYQIQSGEIDISNCLIVTDVDEVPTPQEYLASLNTIPINAYPNPVNGSQITFSYQNTEHNQNMELRCFDVFGKQVHTEKIYQFQGESKVNVGSWKKGVYVALVYSNGKIAGMTKFVIQ